MKHHRIALYTITSAALLDTLASVWYASVMRFPITSGLCYALGVATTSGSSIPAGTSPRAHLVTALIQVTVLPLFGATFSLATSALSGLLVTLSERRIKAHVEQRLRHHLGKEDSPAE